MPDSAPLRVLILADSEEWQESLASALDGSGVPWEPVQVVGVSAVDDVIATFDYDLVAGDPAVLRWSAPDLMRQVAALGREVAVAIVARRSSVGEAAAALKAGALDYQEWNPAGLEAFANGVREWVDRGGPVRQGNPRDASRELLRTVIDLLPAFVYARDLEGRYLLNNRANQKMLGVESESESLGRRMEEFFPPETAERFSNEDRLAMRSGGLFNRETPYEDPGGVAGWLLTSKLPLRDESGKAAGVVGISRDITHSKQIEEDLRRSEERMRLFLEHAPVSVAVFDTEMRFLFTSRKWLSARGLEGRSLKGRSLYDVAPNLPEQWREVHQSCLAGAAKSCDEDLWVTGDGRREWVRWAIHPWHDPSGVVGGIIIFSEFVTRERRMRMREAAFARLGRSLASAANAREAAEVIASTAQQLLGWESCFVNLCRPGTDLVLPVLELDTVDGQVVDLTPESAAIPPGALVRRVFEEGAQLLLRETEDEAIEGLIPFGDVQRRSRSLMFAPLRTRNRLIGLLSIQSYRPNAYDKEALETLESLAGHCSAALDRVQSEERLRAREKQYRDLVETSQDLIWSVDAEGCWSFVNQASREVYGREPETMIGKRMVDFVAAGQEEALQRSFARLEAGRPCFECRIIHRHADGTPVVLSFNAIPLRDESGRMAGATGTARDITREVELEAQVRLAQKMEAVGLLAGGVAHDFNNLLQVIQGYADLSLAEAGSNRLLEQHLKYIRESTQRGTQLARRLLAFGRQQPLVKTNEDLGQIVADLLHLVRRVIGENIELVCRQSEVALPVRVDKGQIEQCLMNIILNARDALPRGGKIAIRLGSRQLDEAGADAHPNARPGDYVYAGIEDNGCGMEPPTVSRIFEPFFTTKPVESGTGLGLSIAYGIVRQHEGFLTVESRRDEGSVFELFLPAGAEAKAPEVERQDEAPAGGAETILFAEDEEAVRMLGETLLERAGYRVLTAPDGEEAVRLFAAHREEVDMLLLNEAAPRRSGSEAAGFKVDFVGHIARWDSTRMRGYEKHQSILYGLQHCEHLPHSDHRA